MSTPTSPAPTAEPSLFTIETPRLLIRTKLPSDAPAMFAILSTEHYQKYSPQATSEAGALRWISLSREWFHNQPRTGASFTVVDRETGAVVGEAGMGGIRGVKGEGKGRGGDAGIVLDERWCGKGLAVESLEASLSWCFAEEGEKGDEGGSVEWIELGTSSENEPMRGVLERVFGFVGVEAPMPESRAGGRVNAVEVSYKFTKEEWEKEGGARDRAKAWLKKKIESLA